MENLNQFWWKNGQKRKIAIFRYFLKIEITQAQNDLEGWNLAKLWRIIISKIATRGFLIIWALLKILPFSSKIWPKFLKNGQIFDENGKISKNTQIIKKRRVAILDNIMLHNLVKFQLSRSFWTWVISIFVKYQKIAILRFWPFFHQNWSKFSKL